MSRDIGGGPSPEEMDIKIGRPTEADFRRKIEGYLALRGDIPAPYDSAKEELEDMAEGGGSPETKEKYYSGWTVEDFQTVLKLLNEAEKETKSE